MGRPGDGYVRRGRVLVVLAEEALDVTGSCVCSCSSVSWCDDVWRWVSLLGTGLRTGSLLFVSTNTTRYYSVPSLALATGLLHPVREFLTEVFVRVAVDDFLRHFADVLVFGVV